MIKVQDKATQNNIEIIYKLNQGHIFRFWDDLVAQEKSTLLSQINGLEYDSLHKLIDFQTKVSKTEAPILNLEPADVMTLEKRKTNDTKVLPVGIEALQKGQVAVFLVAGGQGSRLGFEGPKGVLPITPVKQKSLFQLFAEKLLSLQRQYDSIIPWYIMTSQVNHEQTKEFFKINNYFELSEEHIHFIKQDMLPAFNRSGKMIMEEKHKLFFSPNGHGGSLQALNKSGALSQMKQHGVKYIFYFQVDNVLVNMCDPLFLGYHITEKSQMSTKVVRKISAEERMGIICKINGRDGVVEYSDLSEEKMYAKDKYGSLEYWGGNIAIHILSVDFLDERAKQGIRLPYHKAEKSIPFINEQGVRIKPEDKNGIKYETFIFDLLQDVERSFTMEVERKEEFSAVKNSQGTDSPETARKDLLINYARLLTKAGISIEVDENGIPLLNFEISPLFAQSAEQIIQKKEKLPEIMDGVYLSG